MQGGAPVVLAGDTLGRYRFLEPLGEGAAGVVWRAFDSGSQREVAVKLLSDRVAGNREAIAHLEREAQALATLDHPNIVGFHRIESVEGHRLLAMELVRGHTLDALIPREGLPLEGVLALALPLASALESAHARGVVHRDLKPHNVMVDEEDRPKILDFGIAAVLPRAPLDTSTAETVTLCEPGTLRGTIPYMAPEQAQGLPADAPADIFSLGVMIYEMATGTRPFAGATTADVLASILRDEPEPPSMIRPELPPEFDRLIARCLEKDPRHRIATARELRLSLEALRGLPATAPRSRGPSVAVFPFVDLSRERNQEYFGDGVAEAIIAALTRVAGLRVASRTSSFRLRDARLDTHEIGRRLHVRALLEGSVRRAGERLHVSAALVDVETGDDLWSASFDRDLAAVFEIEEEIARRIVAALEVTLSHDEHETLRRPPTSNVQAYDFYLRGRSFYYQYRRNGIEFALQMFRRALELDPGFARAWAGVADCYCFLFLYVSRVALNIERAEEASRKALELDPELAEAQASWGVALSIAGQDDAAVAAFTKAIALDPGLFEARYFFARHSFARGDLERAVQLYSEAEALRPEDYQSPLLVAQIYLDLGRREEGEAAYRRGLRRAEDRLRLHPDDTRARYMGANALAALGDRARAMEWARAAAELEPDEPMLLYNVGCIYAMVGELDRAVDVLTRAVDNGLTQRGWFQHDSNLDSLRTHPGFVELMRRL